MICGVAFKLPKFVLYQKARAEVCREKKWVAGSLCDERGPHGGDHAHTIVVYVRRPIN